MAPLLQSVLALLSLGTAVSALKVTPGSPCAGFCIDVQGDGFDPAASSTNATDMVCQDIDYTQTDTGIKFQQCLDCLQKSTKVNGSESDVSWYLC